MIFNKSPQEMADFLEMKIICNSHCEYHAIPLNTLPFSPRWEMYKEEVESYNDAEKFYKDYRMALTRILATENYNNYFIPTDDGDLKMLISAEDGTHSFVKGYHLPLDKETLLNIPKALKWDKIVYVPQQETVAKKKDREDNEAEEAAKALKEAAKEAAKAAKKRS